MARTTLAQRSVVAELGQFVPVTLNVDHNGKKAAVKEKVVSVPRLIVTDAAGKVIRPTAGDPGPSELVELLMQARSKAKT